RSLGFLVNPALLDELRGTQLGAVLTTPALATQCPVDALLHVNPHATFARIAALLHPVPPVAPGIHPTAIVHADAVVDASAVVGPYALVEEGARIAPRCRIGAHGIVGAHVTV